MRWPWDNKMKTKGSEHSDITEVINPARQEISKSQDRLARIHRIVEEARRAEILVKRTNGVR